MSTETQTASVIAGVQPDEWIAGATGGFLGSLLMGLLMPASTLEMAVPALYGIDVPALIVGWVFHQFHGVALGLLYVALVQSGPAKGLARNVDSAIGLGIGYGILTTAIFSVIVMPLWLSAVGFAGPPFPNLAFPGTMMSTIFHIIYAVPVTVAYALVTRY